MVTTPQPQDTTIKGHQVTDLLEAIELAIFQLADLQSIADEAEDWDEDQRLSERIRDMERLRRELKIACGIAKDFDEHWECGDEQFLHIPAGTDDHYVWTVTDADGELCISPGRHFVNFQHYYITTKPWTEADLETEWILT